MNKDQQYQEYLGSGGQLPYEEFVSAAMLLSSMEEPVKKKEDTQPIAENLSIDENGIPTNVSVPISNDLELNPEQQQVLQNQATPISSSSLGNAPQPTSTDLPLTGMESSGVGNSDLVQRPTFKPASPINAGSISLPAKPIQNTLAQKSIIEDPIDILGGKQNDIQGEINPKLGTPEELAADEARSLELGNQGRIAADKQSQEFFDKYLNKDYINGKAIAQPFNQEGVSGLQDVTQGNNEIIDLENKGVATISRNQDGSLKVQDDKLVYKITDRDYYDNVYLPSVNALNKDIADANVDAGRFNLGNAGNEPDQDGFGEFVSQANKFGVIPTNEEYSQLTTDESRQEYLATLEATQNAQKNGTTLQQELDKVRPNYLLSDEVKINSGFNAVNLLNQGIENGDTKDQAELNYFTKFFADKNNVMDFGEYWEREGKAKHQSSLIRENQANYQATRANIWNEYLGYKNDKLGTNQRFLEEAVVQSSARADKYAQDGNAEALAQEKAKMENLYSQYEANEGKMIAVSNVFNESNRNFTTLANKRKEESDFEMKVQNGEVGANVKNILGQIPLAISSSLTSTLTGIGRIASSILPSDNLKDAVDIASDTELKVGNIKVASLTDKIKTFKGSDGFDYKEINGKTYGVKSDGKIFTTNYQQNGNETNVKEDTEYKASGMVFLTAKMAADIYLTTGVGKGINATIGSSANRIANSTKVAQVFGEGSQMAKTASSFARLAKNADNVSVTGWYVQMYNDSYRMAEQGGISDPLNKHLYAISMSFMQSMIQRINPDTNFLKPLNTSSRQIVRALIEESPATAKQLVSKFLKETADASIQFAKKAGNNVPKEVLEEVIQQGTQDLSNLVINATANTNFETSSAQDYEEVVVGTIVPAAVASLLGGSGSRIATVNNKEIDLTTYSRNDLITELARDTKGAEIINNFKTDAFFQSQKDAAQKIEEEIKTRKKYVDTIPDVQKYSTPALSDIAPILQKIDQKKADLKNDDGTFTERINKDIAELTTQANAILDNDLNLSNEDTTPTNETPETVQGEEAQANPIQPNPNTPNTPSGSGVEINTENNGSTPVQELYNKYEFFDINKLSEFNNINSYIDNLVESKIIERICK